MAEKTQGERLRRDAHQFAANAEHLLATGDHQGALAAAERGLSLIPNDAYGLSQKGLALMGLRRPREAATAFATAIQTFPHLAALHISLGNAHRAAGDHAQAVDAYEQATRLEPGNAGAWQNLGQALIAMDRFEAAADGLRRACVLDPHSAGAWNSLGVALHELAAGDQAACAFDQAGRQAPAGSVESVRALWNRSMLCLADGDMRRGWDLYEYRADGRRGHGRPPFGLPYIEGRPRAGSRILITVEQGLGDIIMVLRFLPLLAAEGVQIILQRPAAMRRLLDSVPGVTGFLDDGSAVPPVDGVLPCMSLPGLFVETADVVPGEVPYLSADPALAAAWRPALASASGLKVGFVWAGNPAHARDRARSPGLAAMLPLMQLDGLTPVILQKGGGRSALDSHPLPDHAIDLGPDLTDLADTLAVCEQLDLVVSCCTMPAHLAAAAGRPVHVLVSCMPDWRWGYSRTDSPWYPGVTLFRQVRPGSWEDPVLAAKADLTRRIARH